ncbi:MAG: glycosyltransferase family 1 protein [Proteiniphilum sp.]
MNKKKLLFLIFHGIDSAGSGIHKKIKSQFQALKNIGINSSISYLRTDDNNQYDGRLIDNQLLEEYTTKFGIQKRWHWRFKFNRLLEYIIKENINTVFIRYTHFANPFFVNFLKKLNKLGVYVVMEIPTYPYDAEYKNTKQIVNIAKQVEVFYRRSFNKYVDKIVTFSNAEEIFGVKTIKINNGIDIDSIPLKTSTNYNNEIHLIAVASMELWHGYDRLIEGLKNYYSTEQKIKVYLHFVGDSNNTESLKYKHLVDLYKLGSYILFHGFKHGAELDDLFNVSDIAIGCLGVHRKNITYIKSLKNSEYCARGIPFIYSEIDDLFENKSFILKVPADESPVDINHVINFWQSNTFNPEKIRKLAEENLTWEKQMQKVISQIFLFNEKL